MPFCKPCRHPLRDEIDAKLVAGTPLRTLRDSYHISLGSLSRHREHVKNMIRERTDGQRQEHGSELLARVLRLAGEAEEILQSAKAASNLKAATSAIVAAVRTLELVGRLSGELAQPNTPGLHFHVDKSTHINVNYDFELAVLVKEATKNFDAKAIAELKALADSAISQP
jgi:hypothetical protein